MTRRPFSVVCLMIVLFIYLGIRFTGAFPSACKGQEGEYIEVTGRVYKKETKRQAVKERNVLYLQLISEEGKKQADAESGSEKQNIICYLKANQTLPEMGSIVKIKGKLKFFDKASNPGQFDAESYYHILKISYQLNQAEIQAKSNTYSKAGEALFRIREKFSSVLEESLPVKEASVMKTMLLGEKGAAHEEIKALYQRNGIAHILAISGLHISLIGMALFHILKKLGMPIGIQTLIPFIVIVFYGFLTGFSVSALRAVFMFGIHMAALLLRRTYDMVTAASLAAVLLLLDQPLYLFYSAFLFSFGCIFAIGLLVPALTKAFLKGEKQPGHFPALLLSGISLTLAGLPMQLQFFYQIPLYATVLNLLIIPLMSLLLPGGILLIVSGSMGAGLQEPLSALIIGVLTIYESGCRLCENLPFHFLTPGKPREWQIVSYIVVFSVIVLLKRKLSLKTKWAAVFCAVLLLVWPPQRDISITFLDVGQGDCIHVRSKEGHHYLIDGGSSDLSEVGMYRILPYLKSQGAAKIEAVFVTHPDEDHCNGIKEIAKKGKEQGILIKRIYLPDVGEASRTKAYRELVQTAQEAGIAVDYIGKGQSLWEGEMLFQCLHPDSGYENSDANCFSTVLLLRCGEFQTLLTGDVEGEGESRLLFTLQENGIKNITVLKAAHHGSAHSSPEELLSLLSPAYTVISCGENNSYGHPHEELIRRLKEQKTEIFITYESGAVTFCTDGKTLRIEEFLEK